MNFIDLDLPEEGIEMLVKSIIDKLRVEGVGKFNNKSKDDETLFGIADAQILTGLSKQTIYNKVSRREIPHYRKNGRLYFSSIELSDWIKSGKRNTNKEVKEISIYFSKRGGKNG